MNSDISIIYALYHVEFGCSLCAVVMSKFLCGHRFQQPMDDTFYRSFMTKFEQKLVADYVSTSKRMLFYNGKVRTLIKFFSQMFSRIITMYYCHALNIRLCQFLKECCLSTLTLSMHFK